MSIEAEPVLVESLTATAQYFLASAADVVWAAVQVAHAFFGGMAGTVWATLEAFAGFLGTSVQFVICESSQLAGGIVANIVILLLIVIALFAFPTPVARKTRAVRGKGKKKLE